MTFQETLERVKNGTATKGKTRINTHSKMKRSQAAVGQLFSDTYKETYIQTPASGAFATYNAKKLSKEDAAALAGDIRVSGCRLVIEVKAGYEDISFSNLFGKVGSASPTASYKSLKKWFEQIEKESEISGSIPVLCWKKNRASDWVIFCFGDFASQVDNLIPKGKMRISFDDTIVFALDDFLQFVPKSLIFE